MEVITRDKAGSSQVLGTDPAAPTADPKHRDKAAAFWLPKQLLKAPGLCSPLLIMNSQAVSFACLSLLP